MLSTVKKALRIKTDAYDDELETYIAAALYDFDRLNIAYNEDDPEPEVKTAVVVYVKSQFGNGDGEQKESLFNAYCNLRNSMYLDVSKRKN